MAAAAAGRATTTISWGSVETILASPFSALRVWLKSDGTFPNNDAYPLLVYQRVLAGTEAIQTRGAALLTENGWTSPWAWGVFSYHHYHSTAWESLLCIKGEADIQFGGPTGPTLHTEVGDLILIPPGVAHKQLKASGDFTLLGSYPNETPNADTCRGNPTSAQAHNIVECPLPASDPIFGRAVQPWGDHFAALFDAKAIDQESRGERGDSNSL